MPMRFNCRLCVGIRREHVALHCVTLATTQHKCHTCRLLCDAVTVLLGENWWQIFDKIFIPALAADDLGPLRLQISEPHKFGQAWSSPDIQMQIYKEPGSTTPWSYIGAAVDVSSHASSDAAQQLANMWLQNCVSGGVGHEKCRKYFDPNTLLPPRVIDVGTVQSTHIRLYIPKETERGRYVALSHCWGGQNPIMTIRGNIEEHLVSIPAPLPQTFLDAVLVTRALGIRYLWIDSLCILQDSSEDWAIHAPQMATIYGNSYVTLAADAAEDSTTGFLKGLHRNRYASKPVPFSYNGCEGRVWIRERGALCHQLPYHDWNSPRDVLRTLDSVADEAVHPRCEAARRPQSTLSTRAWAFQERVLSPRTLHFGRSETGWECRSQITCECSVTSMRYRRTTSLIKLALSKVAWAKVIEEYTDMKLTIQTDRLAALAGLTAARRRATGHNYVFGLSMHNMPNQLLWQSDSPGQRLNIAPTWSWASTTAWAKYNVQDANNKVHAWSKQTLEEWEREAHTSWADGWSILNLLDLVNNQSQVPESNTAELRINARLLSVTVDKPDSDVSTVHHLSTVDHPIWTIDTLTIHWDAADEIPSTGTDPQTSPQYELFIATRPQVPLRGLLLERVSPIHPDSESQLNLPTYKRVASISAGLSKWHLDQLEERYHIVAKQHLTETWKWSAWAARSSRQTFAIV
ncbi:heterokaryon incompatibility protein-domain-containing protein [Paraphoma chrysanthemicola]|nr:heterokaryon incompatibility protein-domain-containing protein [Paraphoma chrysanthemicola]